MGKVGTVELGMELKVEDFIKFRNLIYDKAGLFFETKKIYFVKKRLEKRLEDLGLGDVMEYYHQLKFSDKLGTELQNLINLLTTNETYFFREDNQLEVFADICLPEVVQRKRDGRNRKLTIWSAGCSTGEEPYTLAIRLLEKIPDLAQWELKLLATDIDTQVLRTAQEAVYSERSVRNVPPELLKKHFLVSPEGARLRIHVKKMVQFEHLNLFDSARMRRIREVDFIFCRNVLIYFADTSRKAVVANFYDSLNPGGYIYLGHSESVSRINTAFKVKRAGSLIVHQKPE